MKQEKYIIGIDEVGRGPIAGPVTVGIFMVPQKNYKTFLKLVKEFGIADSKKLTEKKREIISDMVCKEVRNGLWDFTIKMSSVKIIDTKGIVFAIKKAMQDGVGELMKRNNLLYSDVEVFLDGGLKLPSEYVNQNTVIKGDSLIPVISAASILAKVHRDHYMTVLDKKNQGKYCWGKNKGYGTREHYECIKKVGISDMHRKSFLKGIV